jgi:hypothetical protein
MIWPGLVVEGICLKYFLKMESLSLSYEENCQSPNDSQKILGLVCFDTPDMTAHDSAIGFLKFYLAR